MINFITPAWPAPSHLRALTTTRQGGVSLEPYGSFNLADHVGDRPESVAKNRAILQETLSLPSAPVWLNQVHGDEVVRAGTFATPPTADASYTDEPNVVCAVLTADCLPVLLCTQEGSEIAAIHAGWRGLAKNIVEKTLNHFRASPEKILAWLGPAIGPKVFRVGDEVRTQFCDVHPDNAFAFTPHDPGFWLADIFALATRQLKARGVHAIYGGDLCTYSDPERFYSFRRQQRKTGDMATLIWRNKTLR